MLVKLSVWKAVSNNRAAFSKTQGFPLPTQCHHFHYWKDHTVGTLYLLLCVLHLAAFLEYLYSTVLTRDSGSLTPLLYAQCLKPLVIVSEATGIRYRAQLKSKPTVHNHLLNVVEITDPLSEQCSVKGHQNYEKQAHLMPPEELSN